MTIGYIMSSIIKLSLWKGVYGYAMTCVEKKTTTLGEMKMSIDCSLLYFKNDNDEFPK